jgi:hypothetical protein
MKHIRNLALLLLAAAGVALAQERPGLLPAQFAGWRKVLPSQVSAEAAAAEPARAAVLREFGFTDFEAATYTRGERRLEVRAARFTDATGAFGAFTFYQQPQMQAETIGDLALSNGVRVLFYHGNVLVDVRLDRVTGMSAAELRRLAEALPQAAPNAARAPTLLSYLPPEGLDRNSSRYVVGPAGLAAVDAPLPAAVVDFSRNPEVALGTYQTRQGSAKLMLISYPTPQIAAERLRAVAGYRPPPAEGAPDAGLAFLAKRTGPLLAVVAGEVSPAEAKTLLDQVNYDADITWNERVYNPRDNIGNLVIGVFTLIGVLLLFALVIGISFGGLRILAKRLFPDRVFDRAQDVEIIQLHLRD